MKKFKIPCAWQMYGYMEIEAKTIGDAINIANSPKAMLPVGEYVEDSFEIDREIMEELNKQ